MKTGFYHYWLLLFIGTLLGPSMVYGQTADFTVANPFVGLIDDPVQFNNPSSNANRNFWDFGIPNREDDSSNQADPQFS